MEIVYVYQKQRREFGRQPMFRDRMAELTTNILPDAQYMNNYTIRNPRNSSVSCVPEMSEHEVNTESHVVHSQGILHKEGGWPKDVDSSDMEHKLRFRKKVEKDEEYIKVVKNLSDVLSPIPPLDMSDISSNEFQLFIACVLCCERNNDLGDASGSAVEGPSSRTLNVFRDPSAVKRPATFISWHPDAGRKIAVAYSSLQFQNSPETSYDSFIWDVENPNVVDMTISPPSPLVCLKYNNKDQNCLIGGMYNGLVGLWDVRKGKYPCDTSVIEKSHKEAVFSAAWINSKTGSEFFTTSTDGQVLWWDTRKLAEPTEVILIDPDKNGVLVGGTSLDFESTMPTKFMVGSENGSAFLCNKKAKTAAERITHIFPGHHGPITAIQRNPFYPRNFLTIGDWSAKIWVDDIKTPLISSKYHNTYLTDGCWSPTRPAVFCTAKSDGTVDFWDYIFKQNDPTLSLQISNSPITCVKIQEQGKLMIAGARDGNVTMVEISDNLCKLQPNEKTTFSQMLEREAKREKLLESAAREKRLKAQQKKPASTKDLAVPSMEELLKKAEEEFSKSLIADRSGDETGSKLRK